ncbi:MAG: hypothetical protein M1830_008547 [Pleopsidium flavum]|nr:MAG: hypothetical protein M1830_008547 [Pleopsidium flavum]
MAYEGYRSPPPPEQPGLFDYSDPRVQYPAVYQQQHPSELHRPRPREPSSVRGDNYPSDTSRYPQSQKPINEAISSAFHNVEPSNYVPPELVAQITENVIKQLKTTGLDSGTPVPQQQHQAPPPPPPLAQSPPTRSGSSPRNVHTPSSPRMKPEYPMYASPPHTSASIPISHNPRDTQVPHMNDRKPPSPQSQTSESSRSRPKGPARLSTGKEETTLERIWGQLFDEEGHPTVRLGQFLRGLAIHIIEDYEPCHSIVVTPSKMLKYYQDVKLPSEPYPWSVIFDHDTSNISRLYRALECQHHLVQERNDERPEIPGLTPTGFERWATLLIQANPDQEYERLQKAVLDMPISNPDDKKERFPKDISRRLFPSRDDRKIRDWFEHAVEEHANIDLPKSTSSELPLPNPPNVTESFGTSIPTSVPPNLERERKPYSNMPTESAIDDTNPIHSPPTLERERKPYSVQPGGGKTYEETQRAANPKPARSNSAAGKPRPIPVNTAAGRSADLPIPEYPVHQRASSNARRHRSPSFTTAGNDFRRSDGDLFGYQSPIYQAPSVLGMDGIDDETSRYAREADLKRPDWARRPAEEDSRGYESPRDRLRYDRGGDLGGIPRGNYMSDEDYYRGGGSGRGQGSGYDYSQGHGGPTYR